MRSRSLRRARFSQAPLLCVALWLAAAGGCTLPAPEAEPEPEQVRAVSPPAAPARLPWDAGPVPELPWPQDASITARELDLPSADLGAPRPWLGVALVDADGGVGVQTVVANSPASRGGLESGDVITSVAGKPVADRSALVARIDDAGVGEVLPLTVQRGEEQRELAVTLEARPSRRLPAREHPGLDVPTAGAPSRLARLLQEQGLAEGLRAAQFLAEVATYTFDEERYTGDSLPLRPQEVTWCLRRPMTTHLVAQEWAGRVGRHARARHLDVAGLVVETAAMVDLQAQPAFGDTDPQDAAGVLATLAMARAAITDALAGLTEEDRTLLGNGMSDLFREGRELDLERFFRVAVTLDRQAMAAAAAQAALALRPASVEALRDWARRVGPGLHDTIAGPVRVGGPGSDIHPASDAVLTLDLGGDDLYLEPASASPGQLRVVVDFGGNDVYRGEGPMPSIGGSLLGVALLLDLAGDDMYDARDAGIGCGLGGVGVLLDVSGDDVYRGRSVSQGAGLLGLGILADLSGNDVYTADIWGQALGLTGGAGVLVDAEGNDTYHLGGKHPDFRDPERSYQAMGQGFGFGIRPWEGRPGASGGMGLLYDQRGDDVYAGDYFCQGSAYWYACGFLVDGAGRDAYIAGRYSQGAGIHLAVGALVDGDGDDQYSAYLGVSQGCGHDWAVGVLYDRAGNDQYDGGYLIQGVGHDNGVGLLFDLAGSDLYRARNQDACQGSGNFLDTRNAASLGVLLDRGGDDRFVHDVPAGGVLAKDRAGLLLDLEK